METDGSTHAVITFSLKDKKGALAHVLELFTVSILIKAHNNYR